MRRATGSVQSTGGSKEFLPTLSMRRATLYSTFYFTLTNISTHALHAESDQIADRDKQLEELFLPTLSMRRATVGETKPPVSDKFLPTLSMRRATAKDNKNTYKIYSQFVKTQNHCGLCPLILPHTAFK